MPDWIEATTVGDLLVRLAATAPAETAVVLPPDRLTGQELLDRVVQRARGLSALGIDRGTNVGLLMPNCLEFIETFFALAMLGAVTVPINIRHQPVELEHVIANGQLTAIVTTDGTTEKIDFPDLLRRCLPPLPHHSGPLSLDGFPRLRRLIMIGGDGAAGFVDQAELDQRAESVSHRDIDTYRSRVRVRDVALLLYTSGTTSKAKGCQLSHEAFTRTGIARFAERPDSGHGVVWTPCPLFHVGALVPLIGCIGTGATFVTTRGFDAAETLRLLEAEHVTTALPLFPAFTDALMDLPSFGTTDLSSLQQILSTGTRQKVERVQKAFAPAKLVSGYGMTELCGVAASSELDESAEVRLDWDGRPFRGIEMRVVDPVSGDEVPPGTLGEIVARGYCCFDGYYRDPDATAASIDPAGWFHTGDMGVASPDGRIAFRGRYKDVLKVGGENVAALEVEDFLSRHPAVRHVEVVGAPHPRLSEVVAAFIEVEKGWSVTEDEIIKFCGGRVARFKIPWHVRFVQAGEWPMSATKVNKVALREQIRHELEVAQHEPV